MPALRADEPSTRTPTGFLGVVPRSEIMPICIKTSPSMARSRPCSQNTRSRSRSSTACQSALIECSETSSPCESRWKRVREGGSASQILHPGPIPKRRYEIRRRQEKRDLLSGWQHRAFPAGNRLRSDISGLRGRRRLGACSTNRSPFRHRKC
jgi:hypothetical protein